jgi:hypothetical protein
MKTEDYRLYKKTSKKFSMLSEKYHKLSLLFNELSKSIDLEGRKRNDKEFKQYMKELNLDINKIKSLSQGMKDIELEDLKNDILSHPKGWSI